MSRTYILYRLSKTAARIALSAALLSPAHAATNSMPLPFTRMCLEAPTARRRS